MNPWRQKWPPAGAQMQSEKNRMKRTPVATELEHDVLQLNTAAPRVNAPWRCDPFPMLNFKLTLSGSGSYLRWVTATLAQRSKGFSESAELMPVGLLVLLLAVLC